MGSDRLLSFSREERAVYTLISTGEGLKAKEIASTLNLSGAYDDMDAIDKHELMISIVESSGYAVENFQSWDPWNGFFLGKMDARYITEPCEIAMLLKDESLCVLFYQNSISGFSQDNDGVLVL